MKEINRLLESERAFERQFALDAARQGNKGPGWTSALLLFHVVRWRERLCDGFRQLLDGRPVTGPPVAINDFNDRELAESAGVSLDEASKSSQAAAREVIDLWRVVGDRPFKWYIANTTDEAVIRVSYTHPRNHLAEHFIERGDRSKGARLYEETASELRTAGAPGHTLGTALYNVACARVAEGRYDEAVTLLAEAFPMRADLRVLAAEDRDLAALQGDPRFRSLL